MKDRWDRIGWDDMWNRFLREWTDGCNTVRDHQFRVTRHGLHSTRQIMDYYDAHAKRMLRECWSEKEETE